MARWPWLTFGGSAAPTALRCEVPARPEQLRPLRQALQRWLRAAGAADADVVALQIAAGEAAANAVEHAYHHLEPGTEPGLVWLAADVEPGAVVRVEIGDCGRWRPRQARTNGRGRGLLLMRECVDEVRLARHPDGTTVVLRLRLDPARA